MFGQRLFSWLNWLFKKGYTSVLGLNDLGQIDKELACSMEYQRFRSQWKDNRVRHSTHILLRTILLSIPVDLAFPVFPRLLLLAIAFVQPWLIKRLLDFVSSSDRSKEDGTLLIVATALNYICLAVFQSWYWQTVSRYQTKLRNCLITAIYDKALSGHTESSPLTLMNVDTEKALFGLRQVHEYWAALISILVALGILYRQIGAPAVAPLLLVILLASLSVWNGTQVGPKQKLWLEATQHRITYISNVVNTMKNVKLLGLVPNTLTRGTELREQEVDAQRAIRKSLLLNSIISQVAFPGLSLVTFCAFAVRTSITGEPLTNQKLFTSLATLKLISQPMLLVVQYIPNTLQSIAALRRVETFLLSDDAEDTRSVQSLPPKLSNGAPRVHDTESARSSVQDQQARVVARMSDITCHYCGGQPILQHLNFEIYHQQLHLIYGSVGSGKSTLLKTLLGDMDITEGSISAPGTAAFCEQTPWLWNATIEENIIGAHEFDESWYARVTWACALDEDLSIIDSHYKIGNDGSSLSGGQRNRISLARAVYSREKFVVLDDVLSGLDANTETLVFTRIFGPGGIFGSLGCTVVMATHSRRWMSYANQVFLLEAGSLTTLKPSFAVDNKADPSAAGSDEGQSDGSETDSTPKTCKAVRPKSSAPEQAAAQERPDSEVYQQYLRSFGLPNGVTFFTLLVTSAAAVQMQSIWLKWWAAAIVTTQYELGVYAGVFVAIGFLAMLGLASLLAFSVLALLIRSSLYLHARQWTALMKVKFAAWVKQDIGEVVNRFSQDIMVIDTMLAMAFLNTTTQLCTSLAGTIILIVATPYIGAAVPFLLAMFWVIQSIYLRTSKQLRVLDLEAKAPLCSHFLETKSGLTSIKAFGWVEPYRQRCQRLLLTSQTPYYLLASVQNWLSLVLNLAVAGLATVLVSIAVSLEGIDTGYFGLALTGIMDLGFNFEVLVVSWTSLETSLGAIARMNEFVRNMTQERGEGVTPPSSWPGRGEISIRDLTASYSLDPAGPMTIKDVTIQIAPGDKIAFCGRTGSGKSSTAAAILGLLEVDNGGIYIDDVDLSLVSSDRVRSAITTVTQDPHLRKGTLRDNLIDPSSPVADETILSLLGDIGLHDKIQSLSDASPTDTAILDMLISPEETFTRGEMQLLALVRAMLTTTKILILDEPTSSLDHVTDERVLAVLEKHLSETKRTVICIAHRLNSVLNYDKVVVLDKGCIAETGKPSELAEQEGKTNKPVRQSAYAPAATKNGRPSQLAPLWIPSFNAPLTSAAPKADPNPSQRAM
ncbi:ABC transporter-like protein 10 [Elsinoe fawcettii]|nr:ABC transporter-like protein 10 [Elsinoe fawcettii]